LHGLSCVTAVCTRPGKIHCALISDYYGFASVASCSPQSELGRLWGLTFAMLPIVRAFDTCVAWNKAMRIDVVPPSFLSKAVPKSAPCGSANWIGLRSLRDLNQHSRHELTKPSHLFLSLRISPVSRTTTSSSTHGRFFALRRINHMLHRLCGPSFLLSNSVLPRRSFNALCCDAEGVDTPHLMTSFRARTTRYLICLLP